MIEKIKKSIRIFFPKEISFLEQFEYDLKRNDLILNFEKTNDNYLVNLKNGLKLFMRDFNHSDYNVFKQIFNHKEFEVVLKMISLNKKSNKEIIIIDAGANVGYTSLFFNHFLDSSKVFGIEPSKENCEIYNLNARDFNNIKTYQKALCEKINVSFNLNSDFRDGKDWSISTKENQNGAIQGVTIQEIIDENNLDYISLLKIDIEGAERFIFKKENNLDYLKITEIIAIEIHDEFEIRESINEILIENNFYLLESGELTIGINKNFL
jgi:FkbM family methyltransferase